MDDMDALDASLEPFGVREDEIWNDFAGSLSEDAMGPASWQGNKQVAKVGGWSVTLDTVAEHMDAAGVLRTRLRAPYVNKDGFRFAVSRETLFRELGKLLGMQDIETGDPVFDKRFVVKTNDEQKVKRLLAEPRLRELIERYPDIHLQVKDDDGWFGHEFPSGVDELYLETPGVVVDRAELRGLFELFAACLHQLCLIGSAYEGDAGVVLE